MSENLNFEDENSQLIAVRKNAHNIRFIKNPSETVILAAIKRYRNIIKFIPRQLLTEKILFAAIDQDPHIFRYIPWNLLTKELSKYAIEKSFINFRYVPSHVTTEDILLTAIDKNYNVFKDILDVFITEKLCIAVVKKSAKMIGYISNELRTKDVILAAIEQDPYYMFERYYNVILSTCLKQAAEMKGVQKDGRILQFLKNPDEDVQIEAVLNYPPAVKFVSKKLITKIFNHYRFYI